MTYDNSTPRGIVSWWRRLWNATMDEGTREYAGRQMTRYARRIEDPTPEERRQAEKPLPED